MERPTISNINGIEYIRYGKGSSKESTNVCVTEMTHGELVINGLGMIEISSCRSHSFNAGNMYTRDAAVPNLNSENSICPQHWRLPGDLYKTLSYWSLINYYNISTVAELGYSDAAMLNLPISMLHIGRVWYSGSAEGRGVVGYYLVSAMDSFVIGDGNFYTSRDVNSRGHSLRCIDKMVMV